MSWSILVLTCASRTCSWCAFVPFLLEVLVSRPASFRYKSKSLLQCCVFIAHIITLLSTSCLPVHWLLLQKTFRDFKRFSIILLTLHSSSFICSTVCFLFLLSNSVVLLPLSQPFLRFFQVLYLFSLLPPFSFCQLLFYVYVCFVRNFPSLGGVTFGSNRNVKL
jgi:hypothetical protein